MGKNRHRWKIQLGAALASNPFLMNFLPGKISRGGLKAVCVPGLNCYSCPAAAASCPIGALQAVIGSSRFQLAYYVAGFLILAGVLLGRAVCGFLCPFGWFQELLHKLPTRKFGTRRVHILTYLKYGILALFVILLPSVVVDLVGQGSPWFCKYICPSGTLMAGLPLLVSNEYLRTAAGALFAWKVGLLVLVILLALWVYRPFCKYICPLGAVYSLFNPVALYRYEIREDKCTKCGKCASACKMDIKTWQQPNSRECIRCGDCVAACPEGAILRRPFGRGRQNEDKK